MRVTSKKTTSLVILCVLLLTVVGTAAGNVLLSPALTDIENRIELKKCGVINQAVPFYAADFDEVFCATSDFIRIESLPDVSHGTLLLGTLPLSENQIVSRDDFDKIVFSPVKDTCVTSSFRISNASSRQAPTEAVCSVYVLEELNLAPSVGTQHITTSESISACKFLKVADPENDPLQFEVVSYPAHGTVLLSNNADGYFRYTPQNGYVGEDAFSYIAYDCYGNKSRIGTVSVEVNAPATDITYSDLDGHWAHNAALAMSACGLMTGTSDPDTGMLRFYPESGVSRGDFLAMALISAGKESAVEFVTETSFFDDDAIPVNIKSYAEYALNNGIVNGYTTENGEHVFASTAPITRAEAAVIVNNILRFEGEDKNMDMTIFSDCAAVPSWAENAITNLTACGILNGTGFGEIKPESLVSRAETAEILCNVQNYVAQTFSTVEKQEKPRTLLNLFGLLDL